MDGYVVCQLNCWNRVVQTIAGSGKPTLYVDFQYGGSGRLPRLHGGFPAQEDGQPGLRRVFAARGLVAACRAFDKVKKSGAAGEFATLVASARRSATPPPGDLSVTADDLTCLSTDDWPAEDEGVEDPGRGRGWPGIAPRSRRAWVSRSSTCPSPRSTRLAAADKDESAAIADAGQERGQDRRRRQGDARHLGGHVPRPEAVLNKHGANAITINCWAGFYGGHIHAYPCLGFQ